MVNIVCNLFVLVICSVAFGTKPMSPGDNDQDECPIGHYRCKSAVKKCIQLDEICDGMRDCPEGEDELTSYCETKPQTKSDDQYYNPGKSYVNLADRYANRVRIGAAVHTMAVNQLQPAINGCSPGHYRCNGTLNICIRFKSICNGVQDCPENDDEYQVVCHKDSRLTGQPLDAVISDNASGNREEFGGSGFLFHVDNLIIYNSEVKMFNQNSDNNAK